MSGSIKASAKIKHATIEAVITRADGSVENLGTISYYHRNPLKRAWWHVTKALKGAFRTWSA